MISKSIRDQHSNGGAKYLCLYFMIVFIEQICFELISISQIFCDSDFKKRSGRKEKCYYI